MKFAGSGGRFPNPKSRWEEMEKEKRKEEKQIRKNKNKTEGQKERMKKNVHIGKREE